MPAIRVVGAVLLGILLSAALGWADPPAPPASVAGQVLLPDGKAAASVPVYALYRDLKTGEVAWVAGQADGAGRFTFSGMGDAGKTLWQVAATRPGSALAYVTMFDRPPGDLVLTLGAAPVALTGTVVAAGGTPVAQAEVTVSGFFGSRVDLRESPFLKTTTDADGAFRLEGLPPGITASLEVVAAHFAHVWARRDPSQAGPFKIVLPPEATISGRVTHNGQPVAGLKLGAQSWDSEGWGEAVTGADGAYLMEHLPAGKYNVIVHDLPEGLTAAAAEGVLVHAADHHTGADLTLVPGALVSGKVTAGGAPLKGAQIGAYGPAHPWSTAWVQVAWTGADGTYTFRLPAGHNKLYYMGGAPGFSYNDSQPRNREIDLPEGETKTGQDFVLTPAAKLHGTVLLPDGKPAVGAAVRLLGTSGWSEEVSEPDATTDAQGAFEVTVQDRSGRGVTEAQVLAQVADQGLAAIVWVAKPTEAKPLTLKLAPGAFVAARAVDLAGKPVPKVTVTAHTGSFAPMMTVETDAEGRVLLGPLPVGEQVQFDTGFRWSALIVNNDWEGLIVRTSAGAVHQLPALRLNPPGRSQKGWVGDAAGKPVAGALVYGPNVEQPATTDAQGQFELTGLPARGTLQIVAAHPTEPLFAIKAVDPDWGFLPELVLQPLGAVTGQVLDAAGKPAAGGQMYIQSPLSMRYDWRALQERLQETGNGIEREIRTDAQGRFRSEGLLPGGNYQVMTWGKTHLAGGHTQFVAVAGKTVDLAEAK